MTRPRGAPTGPTAQQLHRRAEAAQERIERFTSGESLRRILDYPGPASLRDDHASARPVPITSEPIAKKLVETAIREGRPPRLVADRVFRPPPATCAEADTLAVWHKGAPTPELDAAVERARVARGISAERGAERRDCCATWTNQYHDENCDNYRPPDLVPPEYR